MLNKPFAFISVASCLLIASREPRQVVTAPTGVYIGYEEIKGFPPERQGDKWYHENIAYLRGDSIVLSTYPVVIRRDKTKAYSSSDGGFYNYKGQFSKSGGIIAANLRRVSCDYCGTRIIIVDAQKEKLSLSYDEKLRQGIIKVDTSNLRKTYPITPNTVGFIMNGVKYKHLSMTPQQIPISWPSPKFFLRKW